MLSYPLLPSNNALKNQQCISVEFLTYPLKINLLSILVISMAKDFRYKRKNKDFLFASMGIKQKKIFSLDVLELRPLNQKLNP